jgi:RNA polymerase sigma-32 factor
MTEATNERQRSMTSKAMKAELLEADTELELARNWFYNNCERSLHRLVNAYMRLAISMAKKNMEDMALIPMNSFKRLASV